MGNVFLLQWFGENETTSSMAPTVSSSPSSSPTIKPAIVSTEMMQGGTSFSPFINTAGMGTSTKESIKEADLTKMSIPNASPSPVSSPPLVHPSSVPSVSPSTRIGSDPSAPTAGTFRGTEWTSFRGSSNQENPASNTVFPSTTTIATIDSTNWVLLVTACLLSVAALATVIWARHLSRQWLKRLDEADDQCVRQHSGHGCRSLSSAHTQGEGVVCEQTSNSDSSSAQTGEMMMSYRKRQYDLWVMHHHLDTCDKDGVDSLESDSGWNDTESSVDEEEGNLQWRNDLICDEVGNGKNSGEVSTVGESKEIQEIILSYSSFIGDENRPFRNHEYVSL